MLRADEYHWWCGVPSNQGVVAEFVVNGVGGTGMVNAQEVFDQGNNPSVITWGYGWQPLNTQPSFPPNLWTQTSDTSKTLTVNPAALPLGNQKYVTAAPKKGYVYACDPKAFQFPVVIGGKGSNPWTGPSTFDITQKIWVQGNLMLPGAEFNISTTSNSRVFYSNGIPVAPTGIFPIQSSDAAYFYDQNPDSIIAQTVSFSVPLNPTVATSPTCTGLELGITLDGVELSGPLDSSGRDEMAYEMQDSCNGMAQPGGLYHRHGLSNCTPHIHENNALVGYALDGFGIFSPYDANGVELSTDDLDECHGMTSPIIWNGKLVSMYHYVLTRDFPYSISCFRGTPVVNAFPPLPPPTFPPPPH